MIRFLPLGVYVVLTVFTYAALLCDTVNPQAGVWVSLAGILGMSVLSVSFVFLVMFWFSLLPAWLLATRMRKDATRYFLLWVGYLVFFAPVWLSPWGDEDGSGRLLKFLSIASTVVFAGIVTVMVRRFAGKSRSGPDVGEETA